MKFKDAKRFIGNFSVKSGPVSDGVQKAVFIHNLPTNYIGFIKIFFISNFNQGKRLIKT